MLEILRGFPARPAPGCPGDPGLFEPGSIAWRVNGETAMLVGGGRALLMQVAHPAVAAAVAQHSEFPREPYVRLWRTLDTMLAITFGDAGQSAAAAARVNAVHRRVVGTTYSAMDPELLLWVHATLVDSALVVHDRFVGGLSPSQRERYYREMKRQAAAFEVPAAVLPGNLGDFRRYVGRQVSRLEVTGQARALASEIVSPPVPLALRPAAALFGLVTVGLLPPALREAYGFEWSAVRGWGLAGTGLALRSIVPILPPVLRRWPHARAARRRMEIR